MIRTFSGVYFYSTFAINFQVVENNNMTWSTLKLVPTDDDNQSVISCVASNMYFPADPKEQQITLHVHCIIIIIIII